MQNQGSLTVASFFSAILGAVLGALITQGVTVYLAKRKETSARSYLVARITTRLEAFASDCLLVARDFGTVDPESMGEIDCVLTSELPSLDLESQPVDWSVILHPTLRDLLRLPIKVAAACAKVTDAANLEEPDPPYHLYYYHTRQTCYAELGIEACELADRLRSLLKRSSNSPGDSAPLPSLREALSVSKRRWLEWQKQGGQVPLG